jgi:amicyanin
MPVDNVEVRIINYNYEPETVTIPIGTTVTWVNLDSVQHTVTSRDNKFNSGMLNQNQTFSQLFTEPGDYEYYCIPHPYMVGKVIVE